MLPLSDPWEALVVGMARFGAAGQSWPSTLSPFGSLSWNWATRAGPATISEFDPLPPCIFVAEFATLIPNAAENGGKSKF